MAAQWVPRLEALSTGLSGPAQIEATSLLAFHHLRCSATGPADVLLAQLAASASEETASTLIWLGGRLLAEGHTKRASTMLEAALQANPPSLQLLEAALLLDESYRRAKRFADLLALWIRTNLELEVALGARHRHTLFSGALLASEHSGHGDIDTAIAVLDAAFAGGCPEMDRRDYLLIASGVIAAAVYGRAGRNADAIRLMEEATANCQTLPDADGPLQLQLRPLIAEAHGVAGQVGRAIELLESNLADHERVLGTNHPSTIETRASLADEHAAAGNHAAAVPLLEAILAAREQLLGADHPDTTASRERLASALAAPRSPSA